MSRTAAYFIAAVIVMVSVRPTATSQAELRAIIVGDRDALFPLPSAKATEAALKAER